MPADRSLIESALRRGSPLLARVADHADEHRLQILVSVESPDGTLTRHEFRPDAEYFYPASTVKLIAALAALHTLATLGIDPATPMVIHPCFADQRLEDHDPTSHDGAISAAHEIRKICLVSDNPAHNRLLALVGHAALHDFARSVLGLRSARLIHRLSEPRSVAENRRTPRVDLLTPTGTVTLPPRDSGLDLHNDGVPGLDIGLAHNSDGVRIDGPMSFRLKNRVSLADLHRLIILTARRGVPLPAPSWGLLHHAMTIYPRQSPSPRYDPREHPDHFVKFLLPGLRRLGLPHDPPILNKVGQAYGFTIENAYVHAPAGRPSFVLTAAIYANSSGVLGDDSYDDKTVAEPFMADLGEALARELWT